MLDNKPLATRFLSSFNDARKVEVSRTDFAEGGVVLVIDEEILQMDERETASEALAPVHGVRSTILHPEGIGLTLQMRSLSKNFLEDRAAIEFSKFVMVVVIAEHDTVIGQVGCRFFESRDECMHAVRITKIHCARVRKGRVATAQFLQAFDNGLRVVQDFIPRLVSGTADEAFAVKDAEEFVFSDGAHSAHLNGLITHGAHAAQGGSDFRRSF